MNKPLMFVSLALFVFLAVAVAAGLALSDLQEVASSPEPTSTASATLRALVATVPSSPTGTTRPRVVAPTKQSLLLITTENSR